jgi:hypothetical protein
MTDNNDKEDFVNPDLKLVKRKSILIQRHFTYDKIKRSQDILRNIFSYMSNTNDILILQ